jgi:hypothetical protein
MSKNTEIVIIGVHDEDGTFVLTDANGQEHAASSPDALWKALSAIYSSEDVPKTKVPSSNISEVQGILNIAQTHAEELATARYGPVVGALAGTIGRNGAKKIMEIMKKHGR